MSVTMAISSPAGSLPPIDQSISPTAAQVRQGAVARRKLPVEPRLGHDVSVSPGRRTLLVLAALAPVAWPSSTAPAQAAVPIVMWGAGIASRSALPRDAPLDAVAPTLAGALGLRRPALPPAHRRSGAALRGATAAGASRLLIEVAWV